VPPEHEIDYEALIDRTITDFRPVKRLWRICTRLFFWILMESAILAMTGAFLGYNFLSVGVDRASLLLGSGVSIVASVAAAVLALRAAIPGNEISLRELVALIALICLAVLIPSDHRSGLANQWNDATDLFGLAALPWFALFWAVRRGVPLQPVKTGAIVGLSAFSFALAILRLIHYQDGVPNQTIWLFACGFVLAAFSAVAGRLWLDWVDRWRRSSVADEARQSWFASRVVLPAAVAASITGFTLVVWNTSTHAVVIPDFDLTIYSYQRSLTGFRPNVPSASIESVLADYVEHGMPAYMWDFGPEGFRLVGGRWQPLTDGTPVTYTWFHGRTGGVICMMRQTEAFNPPPGRAKYIKVSSFTDIAASVFA
jgi:Negative regulator of sigma F